VAAASRAQGLPRNERIRRREEFARTYESGVRIRSQFGTIFLLKNGLEYGRLGIAATRKLGGAVIRNRARRIIRNVFRRNKIGRGYDIVVVPNRRLLESSQSSFETEFCQILERRLRR
jgi:ribonuclease P protein component